MKKDSRKKVCIAMSGGVDSSVAAALLKEQGFDCVGIFMKLWSEPLTTCKIDNKCCSADAYEDARKVAGKLGFPLYTLNLSNEFKKIIVDDFLKEYQVGKTPNPCIRCNKFIKFDLLLKKAKTLGCQYLATGHYIKINSLNQILIPKDKIKDQTYFLYNLKQSQLKNLIFPLSDYTKPKVRDIAKKLELPIYQKPESQEICFVAEKNHYSFLKKYLKLKSGPIKNLNGKILGQHEGLPLYTLGQRKGIKIGGTGPYYVARFDYAKNILYVTTSLNDGLIKTKTFKINHINWISGQVPKSNEKITAKIRSQAKPAQAVFKNNTVIFNQPQRAVMPGQSCVFYHKNRLLGGGIITKLIN